MKNACKNLVGKSAEKVPLESHTHNWKNNIKIYISKVGLKPVDWVYMAQHRF
jgi:hypothetical protein